MYSELNLWAKKQELQRELARLDLLAEAKRSQAQEGATEWRENRNGRVWRWRIEPGKEEAFRDLLGSMLPSWGRAERETTNSPP